MNKNNLKFGDLFSGIGGFRLAFEQAGYQCVYSCENNAACKEVYLNNFGSVPENDITKINLKTIPYFDVLTAGFPCQPFSICGKRGGFYDTRGTLFFHICEIIEAVNPPVVLLENVKHILHHDQGKTLKIILYSLKDLGYSVNYQILNAKDFGMPQNRERVFIIATKSKNFNFKLLNIVRPIPKLRDFLSQSDKFEYLDPSEYTLISNPIPQESGLIFIGYRNKNIWKTGIRPNTEHLSRVHHQPNRIYSIDGVHPTIPSQETSGRFFIYIPEENSVRKLTLNECYKIMGFPSFFKYSNSIGEAYKQIGNSVCIPLIHEIAIQLKEQIFFSQEPEAETLHQTIFNPPIPTNIQLDIPGLITMNHREKLIDIYQNLTNPANEIDSLNTEYKNYLIKIAERAFDNKGVFTVLTTLLTHKILNPSQDIRFHQADMSNGFSGRTVDTKYITPTLKELGLPAMAESGWLTRSLEQPYPYDFNYNGKITPSDLRNAFLKIIDFVQQNPNQSEIILILLLKKVKEIQISGAIEIVKLKNPERLDIKTIINALEEHFSFNYQTSGGSKLPVIAFYSLYQILLQEVEKYKSCTLRDLGSHTASDRTSNSAGDIEIFDSQNDLIEAIEIKYGKKINSQMLRIAKDKIIKHKPNRYYIFSSEEIKQSEEEEIDSIVRDIAINHGCHIIINGIIPTIKYYLRLIMSQGNFIEIYSNLVALDIEIKAVHKKKWNEILYKLTY